jgi:hypothetical protein
MHRGITTEELRREIEEQEEIALRLRDSLARLGDAMIELPMSTLRRLEEAAEEQPQTGSLDLGAVRA